MVARLLRWVMWSVVISLLPYGGLTVARLLYIAQTQHVVRWPPFSDLLGSGQLFLTCIALLAGGARELSGMGPRRGKTRDFLFASTLGLCVILAFAYGYVANEVISSVQASYQETSLIVTLSLIMLGASIVITASAVLASTPSPEKVSS